MIQSRTHSEESGKLRQAIGAEAKLIEQFVGVLQREQAALSEGAADDLLALTDQKNELARQLNQLSTLRAALLVTCGFSTDRQGVEAWCAQADSPEATEVWHAVLALAAEARELNRVNGELIQLRMQFNAQALEALRGAKSSLELYGPDGQSTKSGNRRINDAV